MDFNVLQTAIPLSSITIVGGGAFAIAYSPTWRTSRLIHGASLL